MPLFNTKIDMYIINFLAGTFISFVLTNICMLQEGLIGNANLTAGIIGFVATIVAGLIKVFAVDMKFDWKIFLVIIAGGLVPLIINAIGIWFYNISYGG